MYNNVRKMMPIISTDLLMTDDFAGRKGWATSYTKKMINSKMYINGKIIS